MFIFKNKSKIARKQYKEENEAKKQNKYETIGYMIGLATVAEPDDITFISKPQDPSLFQFPVLEMSCDFKGWIYYYSGVINLVLKAGNSLGALNTSLSCRGACFRIHIAYIVALNDAGDAPQAERKINELKKLGTLPASLNLIRINALRFAGALKEAETELFSSIGQSPDNPSIDLCMTLSDTLCYQGKYAAALLLYGQFLSQCPDLFWDLKQDWRFRFVFCCLFDVFVLFGLNSFFFLLILTSLVLIACLSSLLLFLFLVCLFVCCDVGEHWSDKIYICIRF